jgi:hypothetical protein
MQRNQAMVAAELKVVATAIRQLYISSAMMEIGAPSEAAAHLPGSPPPAVLTVITDDATSTTA